MAPRSARRTTASSTSRCRRRPSARPSSGCDATAGRPPAGVHHPSPEIHWDPIACSKSAIPLHNWPTERSLQSPACPPMHAPPPLLLTCGAAAASSSRSPLAATAPRRVRSRRASPSTSPRPRPSVSITTSPRREPRPSPAQALSYPHPTHHAQVSRNGPARLASNPSLLHPEFLPNADARDQPARVPLRQPRARPPLPRRQRRQRSHRIAFKDPPLPPSAAFHSGSPSPSHSPGLLQVRITFKEKIGVQGRAGYFDECVVTPQLLAALLFLTCRDRMQ